MQQNYVKMMFLLCMSLPGMKAFNLQLQFSVLCATWRNGLFQKKSTPPPPTDGMLEILAGGGVEGSGNLGGRGGV